MGTTTHQFLCSLHEHWALFFFGKQYSFIIAWKGFRRPSCFPLFELAPSSSDPYVSREAK